MSTVRSLRNRSSRFSSPATFTENKDAAAPLQLPNESSLSSQDGHVHSRHDGWVEPTLRNPVPSFEDTKGLERLGVLEHMQPLGVPPNQKLMQRLKVNYTRPSLSARATPLQGEEAASPVTESARTDAASPIDPDFAALPLRQPHTQRLQEPFNEQIVRSPPRGRPAKKDVEEMRQAGAAEDSLHSSSALKTTPRAAKGSPRQTSSSIQGYMREEKMRGYIAEAQKRAFAEGNHELVAGLQRVSEEVKAESAILPALDSILNGRSQMSLDQFKIFKHFIKKGIRKHRRASSTHDSPHPDFSNFSPMQPTHAPTYLSSFSSHQPNSQQSPVDQSTSNTPFQHSPTAAKSMPQSPSLQAQPSIENNAIDDLTDQGTPPTKRPRSSSSSSALSSAKSLPGEYAPPELVDPEVAAGGRPVRLVVQRQASNRASGNRTRLLGTDPFTSKHHPDALKTTTHNHKQRLRLKVGDQSDPDSEEVIQRRREFEQASFYDYNYQRSKESDLRDPVQGRPQAAPEREGPPSPTLHPSSLIQSADALSSPTSQKGGELAIVNETGRKRSHDEFMRDDISPASSLSPPLSPAPAPVLLHLTVSQAGSRASTPRAAKAQPPVRSRKSARVMISPNKPKNGGITAGKPGISRAGAGREAVLGNGADSAAEDNEEFCRSCGGEGTLLCCDGCPHSFHHACLEPPLNPDDEIGDEWFCPECQARRKRQPFKPTTLMSLLVRDVEDTYPRAYALPADIREYFEGVKTGDEGEYEEVALPRTQKNNPRMNRQGLFELQNYKDPRDSKGNLRFCYRCGLTSDGRDIIPCDFCPHEWHLDCVSPPLAVPPRRIIDGKQIGTWRCPLHTEDDLRHLSRQPEAAPGDLGRVPRLRRPRDARPKDINLPRGFRNTGVIDVDLEKDEMPDVKETDMGCGVYRLPERGIKLDFIDRVKQTWYEDHAVPRQLGLPTTYHERVYRPDGGPVQTEMSKAPTSQATYEQEMLRYVTDQQMVENAMATAKLRQKSFLEQRVALGLLELAAQYPNSTNDHEPAGDGLDAVSDLINQLVSDAPEDVTESINIGEKEQLMHLKLLVESRLALLQDVKLQTEEKEPAEEDTIRPLSRSRSRTRNVKRPSPRSRFSDPPPSLRKSDSLKTAKSNGLRSAEHTPKQENSTLKSAHRHNGTNGRLSRTSSPHLNGGRLLTEEMDLG